MRWLPLLLLLVAGLRVGLLVFATPIVGYANQYDQARTSDCANLWPTDDSGNAFSDATPAAPRSRFVRADLKGGICQPSSAAAAAWVAYGIYAATHALGIDDRATMDVRYLGGLYALVLAALATWNHARLHTVGARTIHALAVLLLLADPFTTLFFNTLYTEAPAAIAFYAAVMILFRSKGDLRRGDCVVFVAALIALGAARPAHFGLPILFGVLFVWRLHATGQFFPRYAALTLLVASAIAAGQLFFNVLPPNMRLANRTNAIMLALAPNANDPAGFLGDLGLPPSCRALLGTDWFNRYGHDPARECPALTDVPTWRVAAVAAQHPESLLRALYRVQLYAGAWRLPYVGEVEGRTFGTSAQRWPLAGWSFADLWPRVPFWGRLAFYAVPVMLALLAPIRPRSPTALAFLAAGGTVATVWLVSVLGDGYGEPTRHVHVAILAALGCWGTLGARALLASGKTPRVVWLAIPAVATAAAVALSSASPFAKGHVDRFDGSTLTGWVIASALMQDIRLFVAGTPVPIELDGEAASAEVAAYFALPNLTQARRWHADVPSTSRCRAARLDVQVGSPSVPPVTALTFGLGPGSSFGTGTEAACVEGP